MKALYLLIALALIVGCNSSSSSGGGNNPPPKLAICQNCTYNSDCESDRCAKFTSGMYRCVPKDAQPGYKCPSGQYSLTEDSCV